MLIDKKFAKNLWIIILAFGFVSFIVATKDLWTSSLWFEGIYVNSVLSTKVSFPVPSILVGIAPDVSVEGLLSGLMLMLGQILFAAQAKTKKGTESYAYWAAYALLAIADTATDVYYTSGGEVTWQIVLSSVVLYNVMSEFGVTLSVVYLWEKIRGIGGKWTGNAKQNVKNLRPQENNTQNTQNTHNKQNTQKQHGRTQQHRPAQQFASQNDNNVVPTLVPRQPRTATMNGRPVNGNANARHQELADKIR